MRQGIGPISVIAGILATTTLGAIIGQIRARNFRKINVSLAQHRDHRLGGYLHVFLQMSLYRAF